LKKKALVTCNVKVRQALKRERAAMKKVLEEQKERAKVEKLEAIQRAIRGMKSCKTEACRAQAEADATCHV